MEPKNVQASQVKAMTPSQKEKENAKRLKILNEGEQQVIREERQALTLDFDQAYREYEQKNKPILIKIKGRVFKLPGKVPVSYMVWYFKTVKDNNGKFVIPKEESIEFMSKVFGPELMLFLKNQNLSYEFVSEKMLPEIMDKWYDEVQGSEAKNEQTPESLSGAGLT